MRHSYSLVTAPTDEPVTLSEAKAWAKVDGSDDDALIQQLITAARNSAEEFMRRSLMTQSWKLTIDRPKNGVDQLLGDGLYNIPLSELYSVLSKEVELPRGPVQSVTSVTTYDLTNTSSTYDPSNYMVDTAGARLILNIGCIWPSNLRAAACVQILYVTGYGGATDVPQAIKTGMMIHVASMYEQRGQTTDAMDIPPGAKQLYNQFRIVGNRL